MVGVFLMRLDEAGSFSTRVAFLGVLGELLVSLRLLFDWVDLFAMGLLERGYEVLYCVYGLGAY